MDVVAGAERSLQQLASLAYPDTDINGSYLAADPAQVGIAPGNI